MSKIILSIMLLITLCLFAGCIRKQSASITQSPAEREAKAPADAMSHFADSLFTQSMAKDENTLISPISVALALGIAANGASGATLQEFEQMLGDKDQMNAYYQGLISSFQSEKISDVRTFNSIYVNDSSQPHKTFLRDIRTYFFSEAHSGRFGDPKLVEQINRDVARTTNNLITQIIDSLSPNDKMVILNTLYFKGAWANAFNEHATKPAEFTTSSGRKVTAGFMQNIAQFPLYTDDNATTVLLPYQGGRFHMILMLPREGKTPPDILDTATSARLAQIASSAVSERLLIRVPKFEAEARYEYGFTLQNMGLRRAFSPTNADFSAMMDIRPLFISQVVHKTKMIVDENGTEAAAATAITMRATSVPTYQQEIIFDRPFIFAIWDNENKVPLFLGVLENPPSVSGSVN